MAAADCTGRKPDARSSNGTPLYKIACPDCGAVRLGDKRKFGKRCHPCAMRSKAKHGLTGHPLFRLLNNMRARCEYESASGWKDYGARGIKVCEQWKGDPQSFVDWALANGYAKGLEIDRIDVDGHYSPENCRFIPHLQNSQNRRNQRCDLETARKIKKALEAGKPMKAIASEFAVPYMVVWHIRNGNTWRNA